MARLQEMFPRLRPSFLVYRLNKKKKAEPNAISCPRDLRESKYSGVLILTNEELPIQQQTQPQQQQQVLFHQKLGNLAPCLRNRTTLRFDFLHSFMVFAQTFAFLVVW